MLVHPEALHAHLVGRTLVGLGHLVVAAHQEFAAGHVDHAERTADAIARLDRRCAGPTALARTAARGIPVRATRASQRHRAGQGHQQESAAPCGFVGHLRAQLSFPSLPL
ncbi:hypothetical protein D3C86_1671770 [compost metagenome]